MREFIFSFSQRDLEIVLVRECIHRFSQGTITTNSLLNGDKTIS